METISRVNFVFVLHFHQPVGQLEWVYDRIYNNCYKVLLNLLAEYPKVRVGIHVSGPLLHYMIERYSEWVDLLKELIKKGSVEPLAGAYGEAILPMIPREDAYRHVELYLELFKNIFGTSPRGFWLAERVWEPSVVEALAANGLGYTVVDDYIIPKVMDRDMASYAWMTEEGGFKLKLLFIDERLRYIMPWESPEKVVKYILGKGDEKGNRYVLWGSDAEKFGEWSEKAWAVKWLREFFELLDAHSDNVKMLTPGEYLDSYGVRGLIYPVYGSYDKMMSWSLGYFRNFLIKYREANYMHKRVLWLRKKLKKLKAPEEAWRYYYYAQCNDAYWHGLFGGVYITHLRQAVFENIIKAEVIAEEESKYFSTKDLYTSIEDLDFDGQNEIIMETRHLNLVLKPSDGGTIAELSFKHPRYMHNLLSTMSRYREPYLAASTTFRPDWYQRVCARDHLWNPNATFWDWVNNTPFVDQSNLALGSYGFELTNETTVKLGFNGHFYGKIKPISVEVVKYVHVDPRSATVKILHGIKNVDNEDFTARVGFDYHLSPRVPRKRGEGYQLYSPAPGIAKHPEEVYLGSGRELRLTDSVDINITLDRDVDIWVAPIVMPTRTERGVMDILQSLGMMFSKVVTLYPGEEFVLNVEIRLGQGWSHG